MQATQTFKHELEDVTAKVYNVVAGDYNEAATCMLLTEEGETMFKAICTPETMQDAIQVAYNQVIDDISETAPCTSKYYHLLTLKVELKKLIK